MSVYHLYSDGNYFPRAKKSGFGGYIESPTGEIVVEYTEQIKDVNNAYSFEILGILRGLQLAKDHGITNIVSHCDDKNTASKLIEIFETKESTVDDTPKPELYQQVVDISKDFKKIKFEYIPRHLNKYADNLSRKYAVLMEENYLRQFSQDLDKSERFFENEKNPEKRFFFSHPKMIRVPHKNNPFLIAQYRNKKVRKVSKEENKTEYNYIYTEFFKKDNEMILRNYVYKKDESLNKVIENKYSENLSFFEAYTSNIKEMLAFAKENKIENIWFNSNHRPMNNIFEQKEKCVKNQFDDLLIIYKQMNDFKKVYFNNFPFDHKFSPEIQKIENSKKHLNEEIHTLDDLMEQLSQSKLVKDKKKCFGEIIRHQLRKYKNSLERELDEIEIRDLIKSTDEAIKNYQSKSKLGM